MKLLIAEDELDLAEVLTVFFEKNQFKVDTVHDGQEAYDYAINGDYDAVILDVMMPKINGIEVVKMLRKEGYSVPIMMLTAKAQKDDRVEGYDAGADDYLPKPFAADELLARVRALLRRSRNYQPTVISFGDLSLDCASGMLCCGQNCQRLSGLEFQLMELFMRSPKMLFSADRLMERIWGWDSNAEVNVIWVHLSNLRKKLKAIGSKVSIKSIRGMGYLLEVK